MTMRGPGESYSDVSLSKTGAAFVLVCRHGSGSWLRPGSSRPLNSFDGGNPPLGSPVSMPALRLCRNYRVFS